MATTDTESGLFRWNDKVVKLDDDGFLVQPELWEDGLASALAQAQGIAELTEAHWKVIRYLRSHYQEFQAVPVNRQLCQGTGFTLREIYDLFPAGPGKGACKIAGLPKPASCV